MTIVNERVLVADDDANVRAYLDDVLDAAGYEVTTSADGQEALECLDRWRPGAILLDVRMPRIDGRAFCERLARIIHRPQVWMREARARKSQRARPG